MSSIHKGYEKLRSQKNGDHLRIDSQIITMGNSSKIKSILLKQGLERPEDGTTSRL